MKIDKYILDMNRMLSGIRYLSTLFLVVLFLSAQGAQAQTNPAKIIVKGLVRDAHTKKPVIAAQISILNSKKTTSTDDKGTFRIEVPSLQTLLHVGAYDYNVREFPIQGKDSVVINLYPEVFSNYYKNIEGLNGVVDNSTSVNSAVGISEDNQSHAFIADEALQTEVGGDVRAISRSAVTGEGASLFIRGLNSAQRPTHSHCLWWMA